MYGIIYFIKMSDAEYLKEKNFQLIGLVKSKEYIESGVGAVVLDLKESNYERYYPKRDGRQRFFCRITENEAYLILEGINDIEIKDSIVVNGQNIEVYRDKKLIRAHKIFIPIPIPMLSKIFRDKTHYVR